MPKTLVKDGTSLRVMRTDVPAAAEEYDVTLGEVTQDLRPSGYLGTREQIQGELDYIASVVRTFHELQPDQVLRMCSAFTARLTELKVQLVRNEPVDRQYVRVRTQQVEVWLVEMDRQWRTASRIVEINRQDLMMLGGQP